MLQADTDCDSAAWIQAIQAGVTKAYNQRQSIDTEVGLMQIFCCKFILYSVSTVFN